MACLRVYHFNMGARRKTNTIVVILLCVFTLLCFIRFNGKDKIAKLTMTQEECEGSFKTRPHYYCLNEIEPNNIATLRYTTNLQTYCSRQNKHGSSSSGWNLCVDGCYKPNSDTVLSDSSVGERIYFQQIKLNGTSSQIQDGSFIDDVNRLKNNQQHLIIPDDKTLLIYNSDQEAVFLPETHCKDIVRLGGMLDGGWEVCNDEKYRPKQPCLVYSFGINYDFKFDEAVADVYGCEVHSFNPSMKTDDFQRSRHVSFHNLGLLNETIEKDVKTGWRLSTLKDIREDLGHTKRKLDIIKIDIEESEWMALPEMIQSGALRDVSQIFLEFHSIGTEIHLKVLRLLYDEGFRIFWYHRNTNCCIKDKLIEYSLCNEVYFVKEQFDK